MKFQTTIIGSGKNTTGIAVPEEFLERLGAGRRPAVVVRVNGHTYRSSVASVDGSPMISLSADNRAKAGVDAGDSVEVELELDTAPREVELPADFSAALEGNPAASQTWQGLSYSNRRWHVESIAGAKTDETRQRRLAKSLEALAGGRPR
jgi:hypothetical protein